MVSSGVIGASQGSIPGAARRVLAPAFSPNGRLATALYALRRRVDLPVTAALFDEIEPAPQRCRLHAPPASEAAESGGLMREPAKVVKELRALVHLARSCRHSSKYSMKLRSISAPASGRPPQGGGVAAALAVAAAGMALASARDAWAATGSLLVYLHVAVKQRAFQSLLGAGLPGVTTTAVGRIADFERALEDAPDAVLSLPIVLGAKQLVSALRGMSHGAAEEHYALLGSGPALEPSRVTSVGALDVLGREGTGEFVRSLVGAPVRVERVTKVEDLLPLLQMERVDAVVLPARLVQDVKATSRLPLVDRELKKTVGLPAAAVTGPNGASVLAAISKMPKDLSKLLGVDEWR